MLFRLLLICYAVALLVLSLVSLNRYVLVSICRKFAHRRREALPPVTDGDAPLVTIQFPIYIVHYRSSPHTCPSMTSIPSRTR